MAVPEVVEQDDTRLVVRANTYWAQVLLAIACLTFGIVACSEAALPTSTDPADGAMMGFLLLAGSAIIALSFSTRTCVLDRESDTLVHASRTVQTLWRQHVEQHSLAGITAVTLCWGDLHQICVSSVSLSSGESVELGSVSLRQKASAPSGMEKVAGLGQVAEQVAAFVGVPVESSPEFRGYHGQTTASAQPPIVCPGCGAYLDPPGRRSGKITCRYCGAVVPVE